MIVNPAASTVEELPTEQPKKHNFQSQLELVD